MSQVIHRKCTLCPLHQKARTVCMKGYGSDEPKIIVFLDNPTDEEDRRHKSGYSKYARLIHWLFARMGVKVEDYRVEYTLKCRADEKDIKTQKDYRPKVDSCWINTIRTLSTWPNAIIIGMGKLSCYMLLGNDKHGDFTGTSWEFTANGRKAWIAYSPALAWQSASEVVGMYRVLFAAAQEAGLKPKFNDKVKLFDFEQ